MPNFNHLMFGMMDRNFPFDSYLNHNHEPPRSTSGIPSFLPSVRLISSLAAYFGQTSVGSFSFSTTTFKTIPWVPLLRCVCPRWN